LLQSEQAAKCLGLSRNVSALIQPEGWARPIHPAGPACFIEILKKISVEKKMEECASLQQK
jgi:hypothetical protein